MGESAILDTCVEKASYKVRTNSESHLPMEVCGRNPPLLAPWENLKFFKDQFEILQDLL